jgi:2-polyprenyl-6-methoxyphenol hydroxylase-like FAD-dependent oxidoreductase
MIPLLLAGLAGSGRLPVGLTWRPTPGVTLIVDAARLMPPVGEGANMAMLEGARLALALAGSLTDPSEAVAAFEAEMFARTAPVAQESAEMFAMLHSPTAAQDMVRFFSAGQTAPEG